MTPLEREIRDLIEKNGKSFWMVLEDIVYAHELTAFTDAPTSRTYSDIYRAWCNAVVCARNLKESVWRAEKLEHDMGLEAVKDITPGKSDVRRGA